MQNKALPQVSLLGTGAMGNRMAMRLQDAGFALTVWDRTLLRAEPLVARVRGWRRLLQTRCGCPSCWSWLRPMTRPRPSGPVRRGLVPGSRRAPSPSTAARFPSPCRGIGRRGRASGLALSRGTRLRLPAASRGRRARVLRGRCGTRRCRGRAAAAPSGQGHTSSWRAAHGNAGQTRRERYARLPDRIGRRDIRLSRARRACARDVAALLADTPAASLIVAATGRQIADADFAPLFPIALMVKDLGYLAAAVAAAGAAAPQAACAHTLFRRAEPWQSQNVSAVAKLFAAPLIERSPKS